MSLEHTIRSMFIKEDVEPIAEDGHQDVASAKRQCKTIIEDAQAIMSALNSMDNEGSLPTWWTNKLAVASNSMNKMNDYISNPTEMEEEVEIEEMKVRGKEVYDKTFANRTQADNYAKKHGGRVQQVGRVFYVFKEELEEAVKYPHMMYDPKTGKEVEAKSPEDHEKYAKMGYTHDKPKDMEEARNPNKSGGSGYDLYHKDFSSAMKHAYDYAKSKLGVEVDPKEIDDKVASGPRKPSSGKTNSYRLKGKDGKKAVQIQVSNLDNKRYELNMYKESVEMELDEKFKVGDKVKVKKGTLKSPDQRHYETKAGTIVKDYKDGEFKINFGGNDDFSIDGKFLVKESVELDESASLIKDYQGMKAQGKKDSNILDALMSMPKYKRMSKDQMAKIIGDAKRKGIFKEEVELTESPMVTFTVPNVTSDMANKLERLAKENDVEYSRKGRTVVLKGKRIDVTSIGTKMGLAQTNLKMVPVKEEVELDEAYKTPAEASAYEAGKKAARSGKKYDDNPNKKGSKEYTAWSKGHNEARAKGMKEEVELKEEDAETHGDERDYHHQKAQEFERKAQQAKSRGDDNGYNAAAKMARYHKDAGDDHGRVVKHFQSGNLAHAQKRSAQAYNHSDDVERRHAELKKHLPEGLEEKKDEPPFDVSKADYKGAAKELTDYAMKKGGMDKNDFLGFANRMSAIAGKKSPRVTARFARDLEALDTSPREKIISVMRNNGIKVTMAGRGLKIEGVGAELTSTQRLRAILETEVPVTKSEQPLTVGQSIMEKAIARIREAEGEKMTDAEMKKRDEIMKGLEKKKDEFVDRYGDRAKEVMARTAIKMAKGD